jgi:hypothetical protein
MPSINYTDLEAAMQFVTGGEFVNASAYVSRETGEIYWVSDDNDPEEELPGDIGESSQYAEVPCQKDLDLGKPLVLGFVSRAMPGSFEEVDAMFRRKGAYSRFKSFLSARGMLEEWYSFEEAAVKTALCEWAENEGFTIE